MKMQPAAELLAAWASRFLLGSGREPSLAYPLRGAKVMLRRGEEGRLVLPKAKQPARPRPPLSIQETREKIVALDKTLARARVLAEGITNRGNIPEEQLAQHFQELLATFSRFAAEQLVAAAEHSSAPRAAVRRLAISARTAVAELTELGRRRTELVKPVAEIFPAWPVNYMPHHDWLDDLKSEMDDLGVGTRSPERVRAKWSNRAAKDQPHRATVGRYANRIRLVLARIQLDGTLRFALEHNHSGWSEWMKSAVSLPPLCKDTAKQWFAVGWEILKEAGGGTASAIPELRPVGESGATYRKRRGDSIKVQEQLREKQICSRLREAFLTRFGN